MKWTRERILEEIRDRRAHSRSLASGVVHREGDGLYRASQRIFGSWRKALKVAGAPGPRGRGRPFEWTREGIIEKIRQEAQAHPGSWRMRLLRETGAIWAAGVRLFGSWPAALKAAGVAGKGEFAYRPPAGATLRGDGPVVREGMDLRLPCRRCGGMTLQFMVKPIALDMDCPRCGGTTRVEAGMAGGRWAIRTE